MVYVACNFSVENGTVEVGLRHVAMRTNSTNIVLCWFPSHVARSWRWWLVEGDEATAHVLRLELVPVGTSLNALDLIAHLGHGDLVASSVSLRDGTFPGELTSEVSNDLSSLV